MGHGAVAVILPAFRVAGMRLNVRPVLPDVAAAHDQADIANLRKMVAVAVPRSVIGDAAARNNQVFPLLDDRLDHPPDNGIQVVRSCRVIHGE